MTEDDRAAALRSLADAALAIPAAGTADDVLRIVGDAGRAVVGTRQGEALRAPGRARAESALDGRA